MTRLLSIIVSGLGLVAVVKSQNFSAPACTESYYNWANNSLHQDACTMAANALAACDGGEITITALMPGNEYSGPQSAVEGTDACKCNTVSYSLISACAGCQGGEWIPYNLFVTNCSSAYANFSRGQYAPNVEIPAGTAFPAWAYDPLGANTFNNATAYDIFLHNTTEFTSTGTSNTNGTTPSSTSNSSHKSHAGAIAGGVVGGVVGLALIAGLVAFFLIRRRRRTRDSTISERPYTGGARGPLSPTTSEMKSPPRLYNPSDPSTFPDAMFDGSRTVGGSSVAMSSPPPGSTTNVTTNGHHANMPSWGSTEVGSTEKGHYHPGLPEL
ncbi:unnamed protein product [Peniophora sp. CBMAI 1063]|nr:unnamed protein product [Peniophora sp. CBMAI 1063]